MNQSRLSATQKDILNFLKCQDSEDEARALSYGEIKWAIARKLDTFDGSAQGKKISASFLTSFSRSINGLQEKHLVSCSTCSIRDLTLWEVCTRTTYRNNLESLVLEREQILGNCKSDLWKIRLSFITEAYSDMGRYRQSHKRYWLSTEGQAILKIVK